eukprot:gnl/MRDRNA2_/MRDRNA2_131658_c0_seq1.p1 gnl/MRDRNA2_/MRDRNA2_131658_c0~~gnl/MRDRNA2_/MRDRNA2_131658_c0_seq1.p1  ORF type:complete len:392 (+),score=53.95 gnl/MRDRNA2_/MRDRNA2_131658_c0_seq1:123-1178(+)
MSTPCSPDLWSGQSRDGQISTSSSVSTRCSAGPNTTAAGANGGTQLGPSRYVGSNVHGEVTSTSIITDRDTVGLHGSAGISTCGLELNMGGSCSQSGKHSNVIRSLLQDKSTEDSGTAKTRWGVPRGGSISRTTTNRSFLIDEQKSYGVSLSLQGRHLGFGKTEMRLNQNAHAVCQSALASAALGAVDLYENGFTAERAAEAGKQTCKTACKTAGMCVAKTLVDGVASKGVSALPDLRLITDDNCKGLRNAGHMVSGGSQETVQDSEIRAAGTKVITHVKEECSSTPRPQKVGQRVQVRFGKGEQWWDGTVTCVHENGKIMVKPDGWNGSHEFEWEYIRMVCDGDFTAAEA